MKALVAKCTSDGVLDQDTFARGLIEYRNTPKSNGKSPAEVVYGREIRSIVPQMPFKNSWLAVQEQHDYNRDSRDRYDRTAKDLRTLAVGTEVYIQDDLTLRWDRVGTIVERQRWRSYLVRLPSGRTIVRNRRFLRPKPDGGTKEAEEAENTTTESKETEEKATNTNPTRRRGQSKSQPMTEQPPRRSTRKKKSPARYIVAP